MDMDRLERVLYREHRQVRFNEHERMLHQSLFAAFGQVWHLAPRNPQIKSAIHRVIGRDLVTKLKSRWEQIA